MMATLACPDETELLVLAMGEPVAAALTAHVDGCAACRANLNRLQAEVAMLRQNHERGTTPPSTERDPALEHDADAADAGDDQGVDSARSGRGPRSGGGRRGPRACRGAECHA